MNKDGGTRRIDIIVPTMWRAKGFPGALASYCRSKAIGSIIVIDNAPSRRPPISSELLSRITLISHEKNIFVNPAWNEGVEHCRSEIICIANDDIAIEDQLFCIVLDLDWKSRDIDIIGLDLYSRPDATEIERVVINKSAPLGSQLPTFGSCMFMPRKNYSPIPPQLQVWFGDDYLVHANPNSCIVKTQLVKGEMSNTIKSFDSDSEIHKLIKRDIEWASNNLLLLTNDAEKLSIIASPTKRLAMQQSAIKIAVDLGSGSNPKNPFNANKVIGVDPQCTGFNILECWVGFEKIPLNDSSVDFVTAFDFIEHVPRFAMKDKPFNPFIETMNEIWRILKPNGIFYARTPAYPSAAAFQDPTHVNIITDQTVSYFAKRPCSDGSLIDPWGLPLGKQYGFGGEFLLVKQWWDSAHLCWKMEAIK